MTRIIFTAVFAMIAVNGFSTAQAAGKKNVLLLISDNQNFADTGFNGNSVVKTPHLDQLAAEGVNFTQAFATTASCGPSRAVMYTGLLTHANGVYAHPHSYHNQILKPGVIPVFALLKRQGYATALIGKDHFVTRDDEALHADFRQTAPRGAAGITKMVDAASTFLDQSQDKPFLLVMSFSDPHPTSRDGAGWGYPPEKQFPESPTYAPEDVIVPGYLPDRPEVRAGIAGYYQEISMLDHGIGMTLDLLKSSGRKDETLVLFFSDHGSSEPGAMGNHYEPGVHIPFLAWHSGLKKAGFQNNAMITLADITPTVLDWTGVSGPKSPLHGRSILPVLEDESPQGWDEVLLSHVMHEITQYYPMRTLRTRRYKLIWNLEWRTQHQLPIDTAQRLTWTETLRRGDEYIGPRRVEDFLFRDEIELYDLKNDPLEVNNLADDPEYAELKQQLMSRLGERLVETNDPWLERYQMPSADRVPGSVPAGNE